MLKHFFKKLFKLSTKEVVKDVVKTENTEDTPMTPTDGMKNKLSKLSLNLSVSTTSLSSSLLEFNSVDLPSKTSSVFEGDVWFLEDGPH